MITRRQPSDPPRSSPPGLGRWSWRAGLCALLLVVAQPASAGRSPEEPAQDPAAQLRARLARAIDAGHEGAAISLQRRYRIAPESLSPALRYGFAMALRHGGKPIRGFRELQAMLGDAGPLEGHVRVELASALAAIDQPEDALARLEELDQLPGGELLRRKTAVLRAEVLRDLDRPADLLRFVETVDGKLWRGLELSFLYAHRIWAARRLNRTEEVARLRAELFERYPRSSRTLAELDQEPLEHQIEHLVEHLLPRGRSSRVLRKVLGYNGRATRAERRAARWHLNYARAATRLRSGAYTYAQQLFDELAAQAPEPELRARALVGRAVSLRRRDLDLDAAASYRLAALRYPESPEAAEALREAARLSLLREEPALARRHLEVLAARSSKERWVPWGRWMLAWLELRRGRYASAEALLRRLVEESADSFAWTRGRMGERASYWLARLKELRGEPEAARAAYAELLRRVPLSYYGQLAWARLVQGDEAEAHRRWPGAPPLRSVEEPRPADHPLPGTPRFAAVRALEAAGLPSLARPTLRDLLRADLLRPQEVDHLAALHLALDDPTLAFLTVRFRGDLSHYPDASSRTRWLAYYPRPYRRLVEEAARKEGIDPLLVWAIMRQESGFNRRARSGAGALGLLQLLPQTGRLMARQVRGVRVQRDRDLYDPEVNIRLGARFLRRLLERYGGRTAAAVAAYNAGPRYMDRWQERWGDLPGDAWVEEIPIRQTIGYTKSVMEAYGTYTFLYGAPRSGRGRMLEPSLAPLGGATCSEDDEAAPDAGSGSPAAAPPPSAGAR